MNRNCDKLALKLWLGFLLVVLIPTGIIFGQNDVANGKIVASFESQEDLQKLKLTNVRVSLTSEHVTEGKSALAVEFTRPGNASIDLLSGAPPWDWQAFGAIAVDVANTSDKEITAGIQLRDAAPNGPLANFVGGHGNVAPHDSVTYYYPIGPSSSLEHGMRGGPPMVSGITPVSDIPGSNRRLDSGHIVALKLSFTYPAGVKSVIIDNVRLLPPFNYEGIVDAYGQYTRADWRGKVHDDQGLLAQKQQEEEEIKTHPSISDRDEYGGWASGPKVATTGFFGTVKRDGKWWLVDPAGRLFFSSGIDVIDARQDGDAFTFVEGRKSMFTWLPANDDPLSKYYGHEDRVVYGPLKKGQTYSFYLANLQRKYGPDWLQAWRASSLDRLRAWGINTIGNWSDPALYAYKKVPYTATIEIRGNYAHVASGLDYWGKMHDPFDPAFAKAVDASVRQGSEKFRDDPWCIGYFIDNEISWGGGNGSDKEHFGLVYGTLSGGQNSPAKKAFVEQLKSRYSTIDQLNKAWGTTFASWQALLEQPFHAPSTLAAPMKDDFSKFLTAFADQYFKTVHDALRKNDTHHLYLGCRFAWKTPEAVNAAARYADVVSFNIYRSHVDPAEWGFTTSLNKPCIIGEFHFGAVDRGMFHTGLVTTPNQQARAAMYKQYLESVEDNPAFVGCHWFQYYDEPLTGRSGDGENYNIGFVSVTDTPYPEMVEAAKAVQSELYSRRGGK
ncbi:MAG: beta-galactosidase [Terriglobia bacterium]